MLRRALLTLFACLALAPAAFAQSAGDDQYNDPFGGRPTATPQPQGGTTPTTPSATVTPVPGVTVVPTVDPAVLAAEQAKARKRARAAYRRDRKRHEDAVEAAKAGFAAQATPEPTPTAESSSGSDGGGSGGTIALIVVVVLLAAGAAAFFVRRRQAAATDPEAEPYEAQ